MYEKKDSQEAAHHDHAPDRPVRIAVTVVVNTKYSVRITDQHTTGLDIKKAAMDEGVPIQLDFQLFRITGHAQHLVRDDDRVTVHEGEQFRAVAADDNS